MGKRIVQRELETFYPSETDFDSFIADLIAAKQRFEQEGYSNFTVSVAEAIYLNGDSLETDYEFRKRMGLETRKEQDERLEYERLKSKFEKP